MTRQSDGHPGLQGGDHAEQQPGVPPFGSLQRGVYNAYGNQTYAGNGPPTRATARPPGYDQPPSAAPTTTGRPMTIDSVVQKTGIALGVVIVVAALTW